LFGADIRRLLQRHMNPARIHRAAQQAKSWLAQFCLCARLGMAL